MIYIGACSTPRVFCPMIDKIVEVVISTQKQMWLDPEDVVRLICSSVIKLKETLNKLNMLVCH